jgi:hypothetical protein
MRIIDLQEARTRILYHTTPLRRLRTIRKQGIIPKKRPVTTGMWGQDIRKIQDAIYAFESPHDALRWAHRFGWDKKQPSYAIIKFRSKEKWIPDEHMEAGTGVGKWLACNCTVPPEDFIEIVKVDTNKTRNPVQKKHPAMLAYLDEPIRSWLGTKPQGEDPEPKKVKLPAKYKQAKGKKRKVQLSIPSNMPPGLSPSKFSLVDDKARERITDEMLDGLKADKIHDMLFIPVGFAGEVEYFYYLDQEETGLPFLATFDRKTGYPTELVEPWTTEVVSLLKSAA